MRLAIIQARMTSSRLQGKVAKLILGEPMLAHQIRRVKKSKLIDKLIVATSIDSTDDVLERICRDEETEFFRGSLDDVLDRFYQAAKEYAPQHVARLTADCPLLDPEIIDNTIACHLSDSFDYTSNANPPTFPDGMSVEVMRWEALKTAWKEARLPSQREHVTLYLYQNPQQFKLGSFFNDVDLSDLRWTVDYSEDFYLITKIFENLYPKNTDFLMKDVVEFLDRYPELRLINSKYKRYEGLNKSLAKDEL